LAAADAAPVLAALGENPFAGSAVTRLSGRYPHCATGKALAILGEKRSMSADMEKVVSLLGQKQAALARMRRHLRLKALLEIWLYVHVPLTFALIAALSAHVISVFFYW
jgi:hypothetical protein